MKYIDYVQLNPFQKMAYNIKEFFVSIPKNIARFFKFLGAKIAAFVLGIGKGIKNYVLNFIHGDWSTKASYLVMGTGCIAKGQIIKGLIYLILEVAYILFMVGFGGPYLSKFGTLGTVKSYLQTDYNTGLETRVYGDNSMLILLYGVLTIIITAIFFGIYISNIKASIRLSKIKKEGKKPTTFVQDIKNLLDERFHVTLLTVPTILVGCFTILPLIFMILMAFTNFDRNHQPPATLFTWVGFQNFVDIFYQNPKYALTFSALIQWTLIWAFLATFSNYLLGMIVALMINKKGIKFKGVFRTCFVMAIAVPQFVTLLLMAQMLATDGVVNVALKEFGLITESIPFLTDTSGFLPKVTIIIVNLWIGIPYTILITSGILMNIPADLYESAKIDGAGPFKTFMKITLPYMLFVTTPHLITQFIGNINNFNVIFFLTGGNPINNAYYKAGHTDLLVTWLYKLTVNENDYSLAATIGIMVFVICAAVSLLTFNMTKSAKNEEEFG